MNTVNSETEAPFPEEGRALGSCRAQYSYLSNGDIEGARSTIGRHACLGVTYKAWVSSAIAADVLQTDATNSI